MLINKNRQNRKTNKANPAFTIVELLVVIVAISILAAITIVSYAGISTNAVASSLKSDLTNASTQLKMYYTEYSSYPTSLNASNCPTGPVIDNKYCLKASPNTSYNYIANSSQTPTGFCLTATSNSTTYNVTDGTSPVQGDSSNWGLVLSLDAGDTSSYPGSGTTWTDLSGLGNNGTLTNGAIYSSDGGGSISLDGVDDYINISTLNTTNITNGSIVFWRKSLNTNKWLMLGGQNSSYYVMAVSTGSFYHSNAGSPITIYEDGVLVSTDDRDSTWHHYVAKGFNLTNWTALYISNYTSYQYNGLLSEIKIYNRPLTLTEITQNYNDTKARYGY